jgi:hypothetical protein
MIADLRKTTFGTVAIALLWLICITGVVLAVPYDILSPYLSISKILTGNPWASLIRNMHYWSSQLFLVVFLLHLYDHFHFKQKIGLKPGMAARLSLGVMVVVLAMLTGFLLKGDNDSEQARLILESLIKLIPFVGEPLAYSLLGSGENMQLIYIHHAATFTVFIVFVTFEHSRKAKPKGVLMVISLLVVIAFSLFFNAPLHDNMKPVNKGPWYFVGFQEMLHWLKNPGWAVVAGSAVLVLIFIVNYANEKASLVSKRTLLILTGVYFILTLTGLFFRGENWRLSFPWHKDYRQTVLYNFKISRVNLNPDFSTKAMANPANIMGRKESCLLCHYGVSGLSESHNPEVVGCFSCHGGNPFATVKNDSHRRMVKIPGNLADAKQSCGTTGCHPEIAERLPKSLMATMSGVISVNCMVFNERDSPDQLTDIHSLGNSAADMHLRNLCANCHLGNEKKEYGPVTEMTRGGGCVACHLNYNQQAENALKNSRSKYIKVHPDINLKVTNNHCFNCHSRSGRISTNYEGWHETLLTAAEMPDSSNYRLVQGYRVFTKISEDVHHKLGLECIDCHHSYDLMGDGNLYAHKENQEDVQCGDCHFNGTAAVRAADELDNESALIAALRFGNVSDRKMLTTKKFRRPLINTWVKNDSAFLQSKNGDKIYHLKSPDEVCTKTKAHSAISCSGCHTSWVSSCVGCHNNFDKDMQGYDLLLNKDIKGTWKETKGSFIAKLPALGVRRTGEKIEYIPVIQGMSLTIDKKSYTNNPSDSVIFQRLFAPIAPHTTSLKGRSCKSCHNSSFALGYGEGNLQYTISNGKGRWNFKPEFEKDSNDGLPADSWIGFLSSREKMVSTRSDVFPLDIQMQRKILTVGACLTCHAENSSTMRKSLDDFDAVLRKRKSQCILPEWDSAVN